MKRQHQILLSFFILVVVLLMLFFYFDYHHILFLRPKSQHRPRQCDSSSFVLMFYHFKYSLFYPHTHSNLGQNGLSIGEFPIIYYFDSLLYRIFGVKEYLIKLVNYLLFCTGMIYLFKLCRIFFNKAYIPYLVIIFVSSIPIVSFYAITALPNITALCFTIIGLYYCISFINKNRKIYLFLSILFFSLSVLLKMSAAIVYLSICVVFIFYAIFHNRIYLHTRLNLLLFLIAPVFFVLAWYLWTHYCITKLGAAPFLLQTVPIWKENSIGKSDIIERIYSEWWQTIMYKPMIVFFIVGLFSIFISKEINNTTKLFFLSILCGCTAYFLLFYFQFYHHDYYYLEILPLFIFIFVFTLFIICRLNNKILKNVLILTVSIAVLLNVINAKKIMSYRYSNAYIWDNDYDDYETLGEKLDAIGSTFKDQVVIVGDSGFNTAQYLINRRGWTDYNGTSLNQINQYINVGAKYLICKSDYVETHLEIKPLINKLVIKHNSLYVYEFKK